MDKKQTRTKVQEAIITALAEIREMPRYEAERLYHTDAEVAAQVNTITNFVIGALFGEDKDDRMEDLRSIFRREAGSGPS